MVHSNFAQYKASTFKPLVRLEVKLKDKEWNIIIKYNNNNYLGNFVTAMFYKL